jgi:peptidoglycan/xylan/chitin deacetylase (PgdA/CDA1 family)
MASIAWGVGAFSAVALPATWGTFVPQSRLWGQVVWRGDVKAGSVALTFDDGPTEPYTGKILDVLARAGAKATFFVVGENARRWPELVKRMHDEGHCVGNHTWSHPHYGWMRGMRYWREEIGRTDEMVTEICGTKPRLFRPPLGAKNLFTLRAARSLGHSVIMWSRRSFDGLVTTPSEIIKRLEPTRGGDIVLMHDGIAHNNRGRDPSATVKAVERVVQMLKERALAGMTVEQMLRSKQFPIEN